MVKIEEPKLELSQKRTFYLNVFLTKIYPLIF